MDVQRHAGAVSGNPVSGHLASQQRSADHEDMQTWTVGRGNDVDQGLESTNSPLSKRFRCQSCQQTFGRVEHLTRHLRSHTKERSLRCSLCLKGFYRIDALRRHEKVHEEPRRRTAGRGPQACAACAMGRRKCSGGDPCSGCQKRSTECIYVNTNSNANSSLVRVEPIQSLSSFTHSYAESGQENPALQFDEPSMTTPQESPISWPNVSSSPIANQNYDMVETVTGNHRQESSPQRRPTFSQDFNISADQDQGETQPYMSTAQLDASVEISHPREITSQFKSTAGLSASYVEVGTASILAPVNSSSPNFGTSGRDYNVRNGLANNSEIIPTSDSWAQNNLSAMNWLFDGDLLDYQSVAEYECSLSSQSRHRERPGQVRSFQTSLDSTLNPLDPAFDSPQVSNLDPWGRSLPSAVPELRRFIPESREETSRPNVRSDVIIGPCYVDGDGARLPHIRNRPITGSSQSIDSLTPTSYLDTHERHEDVFRFPEINFESPSNFDAVNARVGQVGGDTYQKILDCFNSTCIKSSHFVSFQTDNFPTFYTLGSLVTSYFKFFQPILPFIHSSTFDPSKSHWLLTLAVAAIGSYYLETDESEAYVVAMHEFLRRAIITMMEKRDFGKSNELLLTQVRLLNCVGMMYSGDKRLRQIAQSYHSDLVAFCNHEWVVPESKTSHHSPNITILGAKDWEIWCEGESLRRTGYCIWLLDCMWVFHFQMRPLLSLEDAKVPVPCQEVLWEADSDMQWQQLYRCSTTSPSLCEAIQRLYIEKRLQPSMGEFSRILLIHALFRRTWEVEDYFRQPLTLWTPTAETQDAKSLSAATPIWLPGIPTYSKWRNSACDCLDTLHWHANSVIGAASGMEHPTVLHLHLARVVLLAPFRHIVKLVYSMTTQNANEFEMEILDMRKHIHRWATEDQYKARLAMIHAGVLFWHVRRYSADGFYEPLSVFLATLALWAYGSFAKHTSETVSDCVSSSSEFDTQSSFPKSIQLDRPADDELVQLFVSRGAGMQANITGVGNLCSIKGPEHVILEGRKLLLGLKFWGCSRRAIETLTFMAQLC